MTSTTESTSNGSLAHAAYGTIRHAILRCELAPGEHITEAALASKFGLGRAAVRAALTRLGHEELVEAIPRHGYVVAPVTLQQVTDLFGVRLIVEPAAARLATGRVDEAMVGELERLNAACEHLAGHDDPAELREANTRFHVAVARCSGNARLEQIVGRALDELDRVLYLPQLNNVWDRIDASFAEHQRIIDALRARDAAGAEQCMRDHILPNKLFVIEGLIASPRLRSINLAGRSP